jgi:O-antigen/teichoic acid export membrane protein
VQVADLPVRQFQPIGIVDLSRRTATVASTYAEDLVCSTSDVLPTHRSKAQTYLTRRMPLSDKLPELIRRRLEGRDTLRRAFDNSFWLFCDQLLRMAAGLLVGVWIARYLGPEKYGWLSYAVAVVGLVSSFTSLGINAVVVRELARTPNEVDQWMGTAFLLRSSGAAVGFLACVVLVWCRAMPSEEVRLLTLIVALGLFFQTLDVVDLLFQSRGESQVSAWVRMVACAVVSVVKMALLLAHAPVFAFAAAGVFELMLSAVGWWWVARRRGWQIAHWRCERLRVVALLRESWPLAVAGLAVYVQAYADQLVIGTMLGSAELGQYAAAVRLVSVFAFVPMVVQTVAAPEITRAKLADETLYRRRLCNLYRLMFLLFSVVVVPLIFLGPYAAKLLYGSSYAGTAALLPWLGLRLLFTIFGVARSVFITNEGLFRFALLTAVVGAVVNIGLNLWWVQRWGAIGAIAASIASFATTTFALEFFQPRARINLGLMARAIFLPWRRFAE